MISKIVNWFRGLHKSPVDQLIELTGEGYVSIWNGVNYSREYRLAPDGLREFECKPEAYPFIRIGIGKYRSGYGDFAGGDYEVSPIVEVTVDEKMNVRRVERNPPYYNGKGYPVKIERKINKLVEKLVVMEPLASTNPVLVNWIQSMFKVPVDVRYKHCCHVSEALTTHKDTIDKTIAFFLEIK